MSSHNGLITVDDVKTLITKGELVIAPSGQRRSNAESRSVDAINRLYLEMEAELGLGARGSLYAAFRIGLVVKSYQDAAPRKKKTDAVKQLAAHPDIRLSVAQLYRFMGLVKKLPEVLGVDREKFLTARKKEFLDLARNLSLPQALKLISAPKIFTDQGEEFAAHDQSRDGEDLRKPKNRARTRRTTTSDRNDHWLTPAAILDCASVLFGDIYNDPCGACDPSLHIDGARTWTPAENSLLSEEAWENYLFVHPPVSNVQAFIDRTVDAINSKRAEEALLLIPAEIDAPYMAPLQPFAKGFFHNRPTFTLPSGECVLPPWPYLLVFLSQDPQRSLSFAYRFGHLADIYFPHRF